MRSPGTTILMTLTVHQLHLPANKATPLLQAMHKELWLDLASESSTPIVGEALFDRHPYEQS
jgi:hypothetical protein